MKWNWKVELPQLLILAGLFAVAGVMWDRMPDEIPVHWNAAGEVDRYGGKFEGLLLCPIIAVVLYVILYLAPLIDRGKTVKSFVHAYNIIRFAMLVYIAILYAAIIMAARDPEFNIGPIVFIAIGTLFVLLGNVMGKLRPNRFGGIRTPWTFKSKLSWTKTHRLGGWVFIAIGILFMLTPALQLLISPTASIVTVLGITFTSIFYLIYYSYRVYKNDPSPIASLSAEPAEDEIENED